MKFIMFFELIHSGMYMAGLFFFTWPAIYWLLTSNFWKRSLHVYKGWKNQKYCVQRHSHKIIKIHKTNHPPHPPKSTCIIIASENDCTACFSLNNTNIIVIIQSHTRTGQWIIHNKKNFSTCRISSLNLVLLILYIFMFVGKVYRCLWMHI